MADDTSSPAEKVFGIAELAEHILLSLAEASIRDTDADASEKRNTTEKPTHLKQKHSGIQPLACLTAVERVCCAFRDTITSSKKIQKLLQTNRSESHALWLLEDMLGLSVEEDLDWAEDDSEVASDDTSDAETDDESHDDSEQGSDDGFNDDSHRKISGSSIGVYNVDVAEEYTKTAFDGLNADASWRKVPILREATATTFISIYFKHSKSPSVVPGRQWWFLDSGATLGKLFDDYCNFILRVRTEHE
ncbi:hypothetical protein PRZ48_006951 [Zasmidium cellare]|uniref:Uncharacterized protein n=1 Tax=Zasmidium cellare TaxID=395010 RepID=A0ABR0EIT0_ZASCE|nr:hypothetical protein PRZ48_006951 [Zasmidium cellare]